MKKEAWIRGAALLLIIAFVVSLGGCGKEQNGKDENLFGADQEMVDYLKHNERYNSANRKGDTYCMSCEKVTSGSVAICSHCGQYIKMPLRPAEK